MPMPPLLIAACAAAAIALVLAALINSASRKRVPLILLIGASTVAGLLVPFPLLRLGLLELGALLTVVLVWQTARTKAAKLTYLAVVLIAALLSIGSELLMANGQEKLAWDLFITSVCVKLAAVPMFFWLLSIADELPSVVLGLIIAVVDMAAFGEFYLSSWSFSEYVGFSPGGILVGVAAITSLIAALLMLTQRSLKRLLVLSTVEDIGFLLLGFGASNILGWKGAIFAAATHSIAKALLFICLSGPEADGALDGEPKALAARYPVAAFGFLFGMLAMLGIPPTMGFLGRWRLYETAVQIGWPLAAVFILSSIFALIAYVLALTRYWWGPPDDANPPANPDHPIKEPFILQSVIVVLVVLILAVGIWPDMLQKLLGGRL